MRTYVLSSLFLVASVTLVSGGIREKISERVADRREFEACLKELEVSHSDYKEMKAVHDPEMNCIEACLLRHKHVLNNNHLDLEKALEAEHHKRTVDKDNAKSDEKVTLCIEKANKKSDDCEKAGEFVHCMRHPKPYHPKEKTENKESDDKHQDHHKRKDEHHGFF